MESTGVAPTPADSRTTGVSRSVRKKVPRGAATSIRSPGLHVGVDVTACRAVWFTFDADAVVIGARPVGQRIVADQGVPAGRGASRSVIDWPGSHRGSVAPSGSASDTERT